MAIRDACLRVSNVPMPTRASEGSSAHSVTEPPRVATSVRLHRRLRSSSALSSSTSSSSSVVISERTSAVIQPNSRTNGTSTTVNTNASSSARRRLLRSVSDRILLTYVVLVVTATIAVLLTNQRPECPYLRIWLIVNAVLTALRGVGKIYTNYCLRTPWKDVLNWVVRFLTSVSMVWFLVGFILVTVPNQTKCPPSLYKLTLALSAFELAVLVFTVLLGLIIFLFAAQPVARPTLTHPQMDEILARLKTFGYSPGSLDHTEGDSCVICLSEYVRGDTLRQLPCASGAHTFHAKCVDQWLARNLSCPICRDDPLDQLNARERETSTENMNVSNSQRASLENSTRVEVADSNSNRHSVESPHLDNEPPQETPPEVRSTDNNCENT